VAQPGILFGIAQSSDVRPTDSFVYFWTVEINIKQ